jgi:hypothetical protein
MLKEKKIKIPISYRNYTHYLKLGYAPILNDDLEILIDHLPSSSHVRVDAICENCKSESNIQYHKYLCNKRRYGFYGCKKCSRQKAAMTSLNKYGVDNYSKTAEWKSRVENTNIEKYGYKTNLISPIYKEKIENILIDKYGTKNHWEIRKKRKKFKLNTNLLSIIDDVIYSEDLYDENIISNEYKLFRNECRRLTNRNIKKLYEIWDGKDYYDNEDISNNFSLEHNDPNYPTIDHKTSIYYGFKNNIDPKFISDISNLCITKRSINSSKRDKNNITN